MRVELLGGLLGHKSGASVSVGLSTLPCMARSRIRPHHTPDGPFAFELVGTDAAELNVPLLFGASRPGDDGLSPVGMV
ncbi:hypothetical protein D5S18_05225 [Nocardia panacis]|uniref:Uncharacterized protein n=1 Tax=Nocardia panacis TaxID=2340916 RepID=A0A3A4L6D0_9NOCA|nr:hypothetical protein D5S18_05225 [Nocardia panacis]